ncbi:MAG: hypothetical protein WB868_15785, partial [Xanthobacteraceae bacterium]
ETRERHESFAIVPGFRSAQSGLRFEGLKQKFGLAEIASSQHGLPDHRRAERRRSSNGYVRR